MFRVCQDVDGRKSVREESALVDVLAESYLSKEHFQELGGILKNTELRGELGLSF